MVSMCGKRLWCDVLAVVEDVIVSGSDESRRENKYWELGPLA